MRNTVTVVEEKKTIPFFSSIVGHVEDSSSESAKALFASQNTENYPSEEVGRISTNLPSTGLFMFDEKLDSSLLVMNYSEPEARCDRDLSFPIVGTLSWSAPHTNLIREAEPKVHAIMEEEDEGGHDAIIERKPFILGTLLPDSSSEFSEGFFNLLALWFEIHCSFSYSARTAASAAAAASRSAFGGRGYSRGIKGSLWIRRFPGCQSFYSVSGKQ